MDIHTRMSRAQYADQYSSTTTPTSTVAGREQLSRTVIVLKGCPLCGGEMKFNEYNVMINEHNGNIMNYIEFVSFECEKCGEEYFESRDIDDGADFGERVYKFGVKAIYEPDDRGER